MDERAAAAERASGAHPTLAAACVEALDRALPRLGRRLKDALRAGPLTMPQLLVLQEIGDQARPGALSRRCCISTSGVTAALDALEKAGYCLRDHGARDRREVLVRLTPQGQAALAEAHRLALGGMRELLHDWDDAQLGRLLATLHDLDHAATDVLNAPTPAHRETTHV